MTQNAFSHFQAGAIRRYDEIVHICPVCGTGIARVIANTLYDNRIT
jgi:hypothetical protein